VIQQISFHAQVTPRAVWVGRQWRGGRRGWLA